MAAEVGSTLTPREALTLLLPFEQDAHKQFRQALNLSDGYALHNWHQRLIPLEEIADEAGEEKDTLFKRLIKRALKGNQTFGEVLPLDVDGYSSQFLAMTALGYLRARERALTQARVSRKELNPLLIDSKSQKHGDQIVGYINFLTAPALLYLIQDTNTLFHDHTV